MFLFQNENIFIVPFIYFRFYFTGILKHIDLFMYLFVYLILTKMAFSSNNHSSYL